MVSCTGVSQQRPRFLWNACLWMHTCSCCESQGLRSTCNIAKVTGIFLMISHYMFAGRKHGWGASWKTKEEVYLQCQYKLLAGPCSHLQLLNARPPFTSKFPQQRLSSRKNLVSSTVFFPMPTMSPLSWTAHSGRNLALNKLPSSKSRFRLLPVHLVLWISAWPSVWWRRWSPRDNKPEVHLKQTIPWPSPKRGKTRVFKKP